MGAVSDRDGLAAELIAVGDRSYARSIHRRPIPQQADRGQRPLLQSWAMTLFHALIPCAGTGSRAGTALPKQYQSVAGQPMVMHTVQALAGLPQIASGWVVLSPSDDFAWPAQDWPLHFRRAPCGGASRAESVFKGLQDMLSAGWTPRIGCWCMTRHVVW